jgi:hypothetical protein
LTGIVVTVVDLLVGMSFFVAGAGLAGVMYPADKRRLLTALDARPAVPVVATITSVRVVESMRGSLRLDQAGNYETSVEPVEGEIEISMALSRTDRERLRRYMKRYLLADKSQLEYSAGFAALRGQTKLVLVDQNLDRISVIAEPTVIPLRGMVSAFPYLNSADSPSAAPWTMQAHYHLPEGCGVDAIPIWLTPTLEPESDQRTLALDLQWAGEGIDDAPLEIDHLGSLRLIVPLSWGDVETVGRGRALISKEVLPESAHGVARVIQWTQTALTEQEKASRRLALRIRFENQIEADDTLRGELEVTFRNTLSGLEGVDIYHPLGERRRNTHKREVKTTVSAEFVLGLSGLRYQDVRVVPDRKKDSQKDDTDELPGVIPDRETIVALTNAMSDEGYYVKRIIENPPRSGVRANVVNRYWDIAGRRYDGVYPVDFHIILTGEEFHKGEIRASAGNTKTRTMVQGAYANSLMEQHIVDEWDRLHYIVVQTLKECAVEDSMG